MSRCVLGARELRKQERLRGVRATENEKEFMREILARIEEGNGGEIYDELL